MIHRLIPTVAVLISGAALASSAPKPKVSDDWMQQYYQHPRPDDFETELTKFREAGAFKSENAIAPMASFLSRLFAEADSARLERWMKFSDSLEDSEKRPILVALHWAGTSGCDKALDKYAERKGRVAEFAKKLKVAPRPDLEKPETVSPELLDMCWGAFFATGKKEYALTVIRSAAQSETKNAIDLTRSSAQWSLKALCRTHPKLVAIKDEFILKQASPDQKKTLEALFAPEKQPAEETQSELNPKKPPVER